MSDSDTILRELTDSLNQPKTPSKARFDALKVKSFILQQVVPALFEGLNVCDDLISYLDKEPKEKELMVKFDSVAIDIRKLASKFDGNLKKIEGVQEGLQKRISRFDLLEAKYKRMIDNVNSVLGELERVLRQL